jgi:hypothetical protein
VKFFQKKVQKHSMPEELYDFKKKILKKHNNLSTQVEGINLLKNSEKLILIKKEFSYKKIDFHIYFTKNV